MSVTELLESLRATAQLGLSLEAELSSPHARASAVLVAEVLELNARAMSLLACIAELPEPGADDEPAAGDLAFIAGLDLRHRGEALRGRRRPVEGWVELAEVGSLQRHILRAMCELELALLPSCAPSSLAQVRARELERALASRHAYYRFFCAIVSLEAELSAGERTIFEVLHSCATNLARLVGRDIYPHLRAQDRHQLSRLHERVLRWAREQPEDELAGRRLWRDVFSCVTLLRGIHCRPVLVEHDRELLGELLGARSLSELAPARWTALVELGERSAELHAALAASGGRPVFEELEAPLRRLHDELRAASGQQLRQGEDAPPARGLVLAQ